MNTCDNCHNLRNEVYDLTQKIESLEHDLRYKEDMIDDLKSQIWKLEDEVAYLGSELENQQ